MPQQYPSRAALHASHPSRRARVLRTVGASVAAAALIAAPLPQAASAGSTLTASDVEASDTATLPVAQADEAVAAAMVLASGALAKAEHVAAEAPHPEVVAEIMETTFVVRELVRRASVETTSTGESTSTAALPATASTAGSGDTDTDTEADAASTAEATDATAGSSSGADAEDATDAAADVASNAAAAADAAVAAAADLTGLAGEDQQVDDRSAIAAALEQQATALSELLATTPVATVDVTPAPSAEEIAAEEAAQLAAQLAALAAEAAQHANGQIPAHLLSELPWSPGSVLRADAAHQLALLNEAFAAHFGRDLAITDSYRSYADQVAVKRARGRWAAQPGTSNHGYGVAVDLGGGIASFGSAEHEWMRAHAGEFGWENPAWAQRGGTKPEAWHWEYVG